MIGIGSIIGESRDFPVVYMGTFGEYNRHIFMYETSQGAPSWYSTTDTIEHLTSHMRLPLSRYLSYRHFGKSLFEHLV